MKQEMEHQLKIPIWEPFVIFELNVNNYKSFKRDRLVIDAPSAIRIPCSFWSQSTSNTGFKTTKILYLLTL